MNHFFINKQAYIFDLDGTLLDTSEGILESVVFTINALKLEMLSVDVLQTFIGPPIQNSFAEHYQMTPEAAQNAANIFRNYYKSEALLKAKPYIDIYNAFESLLNRGKRLAVATYKPEDYAILILKHFKFDRYCEVMHGADNLNQLKKKDIIRLCVNEMGITNTEALYIGDTKHDAIGAHDAGIDFLGVTYGFGFKNKNDVDQFPNIGYATNAQQLVDFL